MPRVALPPIALAVLAGLADAAGGHSIAFWLLVLAVPAAAIAALATLDAALEPDGSRSLRHAWLQSAALVLLLAVTAVRAPVRATGHVPSFAVTAYVLCLLVFALQAFVAIVPTLRALGRQMKPGAAAR